MKKVVIILVVSCIFLGSCATQYKSTQYKNAQNEQVGKNKQHDCSPW